MRLGLQMMAPPDIAVHAFILQAPTASPCIGIGGGGGGCQGWRCKVGGIHLLAASQEEGHGCQSRCHALCHGRGF